MDDVRRLPTAKEFFKLMEKNQIDIEALYGKASFWEDHAKALRALISLMIEAGEFKNVTEIGSAVVKLDCQRREFESGKTLT